MQTLDEIRKEENFPFNRPDKDSAKSIPSRSSATALGWDEAVTRKKESG